MNRDALLVYLKDLRDLEFARVSINKAFQEEKRNYNQQSNALREANYKSIESIEWGGFLFALFSVLFLFALATLLNWSGASIFALIAFILMIFYLVMLAVSVIGICKVTDNNRGIREHNRQETLKQAEKQKQLSVLSSNWSVQSDHLQKEYNKVNTLLTDTYNLNFIPAPYRNLASMYYIYDYMSTSQASLEDTLLHEHMENGIQRILSKLDTIIAQNEQIIFQNRRQETYNQQIIQRTNQMLASLQRTEQNTLEGAHYAKISAQHTQTLAFFAEVDYLDKYFSHR